MNKFAQSMKLWWMLFWRLAIPFAMFNESPSSGIAGAFGASLFAAIFLVLVTNKSVYTFPLIRLALRKPVIIDGNADKSNETVAHAASN